MKKGMKIFLIVIAVFLVAAGALAVYFRQYIDILVTGVSNSREQIILKQEKNNEKLVDEVNNYLDEKLREPTEEEKSRIESGELQLPELYAGILSERSENTYSYDAEKKEFTETPNENYTAPKKVTDTDAIVSKYMAQLYALQSSFTAHAESLIAQGDAYYMSLVRSGEKDKATARAETISHFTSAVRGVQASCDSSVNKVCENLKAELEAVGADTSIVKTVKSSYENEKKLKLSYYANKYLK